MRPDIPPLAIRGSYHVGVKTLELSDASRNRNFKVEVWYPTDVPNQEIGYDTFVGNVPVKIYGQATRDVEPLKESFPLIVGSHGQPGSRFQFVYLSEHLASQGFVVVAIDHTGSTYQDLTQQDYITSIVYRPQDMLFAIDEIPQHIESADANRVGLMGYSYGGYSAINAAGAGLDGAAFAEYCQTSADKSPCFALPFFANLEEVRGVMVVRADPRIKAVFVMAPYGQPWFGQDALINFKLPFFVAVGEDDDIAVYKRDALMYFRHAGSEHKFLLILEAAQHNPFVECPEDLLQAPWLEFERCSEPVWNHERAHDITKHFALAFFAKFLQGDQNAGEFLNSELPGFKARTTLGVRLEVE